MANYQIWITDNGSLWNNDAMADPATGVGGIDLSVIEGDTLYATGQGTGDSVQTFNFGQAVFSYTAPTGFTTGLPASGGGFTTFDAAKLYGSGSLSGGALTLSTPTTFGGAQTVDGYTTGAYYFEVTCGHRTFFTSGAGGGMGRDYKGAGGDFNHWPSGAYSGSDLNGGGLFTSGGLGNEQLALHALNATVATGITPKYLQNQVVGIAIFLTGGGPAPPVVPSQPVPQSLGRWRGQVGLNWLGMALIGDAFAPVVGLSNFETFTEYGNTMRFLVTTPPIQEDRKRIFIPRLEMEVEAGQGLPTDTSVGGTMLLDWSKDGGKTWSALQLPRSMGAVGDYTQRLRWMNMGQARQWVFRFSCTDPVRRYIIGSYIDEYKGLG